MTYDGDGRVGRVTVGVAYGSGSPTYAPTYNIRSTVMGGAIVAEAEPDGSFGKSEIQAGPNFKVLTTTGGTYGVNTDVLRETLCGRPTRRAVVAN